MGNGKMSDVHGALYQFYLTVGAHGIIKSTIGTVRGTGFGGPVLHPIGTPVDFDL